MVVLASNYYLMHLFLSPLVVTSIYVIQKYAGQLLVDLNRGFTFKFNLKFFFAVV